LIRWFPFLIGTVRTTETARPFFEALMVSIPHRYGKNPAAVSCVFGVNVVSIPHRYGKNSLAFDRRIICCGEFPFLIGTVRTFYGYYNGDTYYRFHSS